VTSLPCPAYLRPARVVSCPLAPSSRYLASNLPSSTLVSTRLTPFLEQNKTRSSSRPNPHGRRLVDRPRPSADVTAVRRIEKPAATRSRRCSRPLASRASVWTTSVPGRIFTVYRFIRVTVPYVFLSCIDLNVCSPFHAFLFYFGLLPSSIAAPFLTLVVYVLNVTHLTTIQYNFRVFRILLFIIYDTVLPAAGSTIFEFLFSLFPL